MTEASSDKTKILIVDDAADNLHMMVNLLHDKYSVIVSTSGEKALKLAARLPQPDMILLDIMMPVMDGYEVLRRLKANPATAEIPVIIVTALSETADEAKGLKMGAADYITKPINPDLLNVRVLTQLELQRYRKKYALPGSAERRVADAPLSILLVDDAPENLHELVGALSDKYRIMVAMNGQKAIEVVQGENPPDLILLDIVMPGMDGYETCRRIKVTEAGFRIPIIFLSVLNEPIDKIRGFSLGAADYISKPFDIDEARARINAHLELSQLRLYFEQQVAERTRELSESHALLEQRVKEEVAKNREKDHLFIQQSRLAAMGEMVHNIAHHWRQPINALSLLLANIKDAYEFNELTKEYLGSEVQQGQLMIQKMSLTIDDFRNFFKPNTQKEHFSTIDAAANAIKLVSDGFAALNIKIVQDNSATSGVAVGFPNEFAQVVLNVLTNAKDAFVGKKIAGEIHVTLENRDGKTTTIFRDNAGGIPGTILPKVFDPYFTTKESGTGIGLYMSKMIMDEMGGDITIRNIEDGVEVRLCLPLAPPYCLTRCAPPLQREPGSSVNGLSGYTWQ